MLNVAVIGSTGLVGHEIFRVLEQRNFPVKEIYPVASERSTGKSILFCERENPILDIEEALALKPHLALFSAGSHISLQWAKKFAQLGTRVIDNSSAWRMDPSVKLVVPEVNGDILNKDDFIIANPNCSTIQMVMVLKPLHDAYKVKRVVVSTYQSVTGTGKDAVEQLMAERVGKDHVPKVYPHPIDLNVLPHIDVFLENGYTKEEMKIIQETNKILGDNSIRVTATTVRVPTIGGHSESVNIEFEKDFSLEQVKDLLSQMQGVVVMDDPQHNIYPMPIHAQGRDEVFVGRIRRDESRPNSINLWCVADNLRKGAATNAVQIAELLVAKGFFN